jgi:hypothetical protein
MNRISIEELAERYRSGNQKSWYNRCEICPLAIAESGRVEDSECNRIHRAKLYTCDQIVHHVVTGARAKEKLQELFS